MPQFISISLLVCGLILMSGISEARKRAVCPVRRVRKLGVESDCCPFSDAKVWQYGKITKFHYCTQNIDGKDLLAAFRFSYGDMTSTWHGLGDEKKCGWMPLSDDQFITGATVYADKDKIVSLQLRTNKGLLGPAGAQIGKKSTVIGRGKYLAFVKGYAGDFVNSIEFWFYSE